MIPLIQQFMLPTSTGTKPQAHSGGDTDSQRHAWKREMERAQSESWFKARASDQVKRSTGSASIGRPHGLGSFGDTAAKCSPLPGGRLDGASLASASLPAPHIASATTLPLPERPCVDTARSPNAGASTTGHAPAPFALPLEARNASTMGTTAEPQRSTKAPTLVPPTIGKQAPVRMHAQWEGDTVAIWLGIDADQVAHATQLVETLRTWLHSQGLRATRIVCNGQLVSAHHHFHITATRET